MCYNKIGDYIMKEDLIEKLASLRSGKKISEAILTQMGVSSDEFRKLERSSQFLKALTANHIAKALERDGEVWEALQEKAISGNVNACRLYFEITNRLKNLPEEEKVTEDYSKMTDEEIDKKLREKSNEQVGARA